MKGILLKKSGGDYSLVDNIEKPTPGKNQILVKSLVAGLNPVEGFQHAGLLVESWPIVVGCDASGVVVEVGEGVTKFKAGDAAFGCTRLGAPGYGTFQEYFLMDEHLAFKKPATLTTKQAATVGVGILTAALGLVSGAKLTLEPHAMKENSEWVVIIGAAGGVGQYAVQLAKLNGYKVLALCSSSNNELVKSIGADATLNYKIPLHEQLKQIEAITSGRFSRVFDASAMATETGMQALAKISKLKDSTKYFATTNDWVPIDPVENIEIYMVKLGLIGKSGDEKTATVNQDMASFIPKLENLFETGALKSMEYEQIGDIGIASVLKALGAFGTRKSDGKKVVVRLAAD